MKLRILGSGTSQGIPVIGCDCEVCNSPDERDRRTRSSAYVEIDSRKLLIDIGPDFRSQMLKSGLKEVDAVLLTHEHNDHVSGLDDIRPINYLYKSHIPIYGMARVLEQLKLRFEYAFSENKYPGAPSLTLEEVETDPFYVEGIEIVPIPVMHGPLPILGFRIRNMAYLTDVKTLDRVAMDRLQNLDVLILNALRREPHFSHLNLEQALELIERLRPKKTYLTHISHLMGLHDTVEKELTALNVQIAYDGLEIDL